MTRLLLGNDFDDDLHPRAGAGWLAQRLMWFAQDDDIVVLPVAPDSNFLQYVTSMMGTRLESVKILVPPADRSAAHKITAERLLDEHFLDQLRSALDGRPVTEILPLLPDDAVARLARAIDAVQAFPGYGFFDQGGMTIANSKCVFRAIAAGVGVSLPPGGVARTSEQAALLLDELISAGHPAILKKDYMSGGAGNEIIGPASLASPGGARHFVQVANPAEVRDYLAKRWDWLTDDGRHSVVVERYFPDSIACYAEYLISDDGIEFGGHGEMVSAPLAAAQIVPAQRLTPGTLDDLLRQTRRLCEALHAVGYRGRLGPDAIVTPDGQLLFTEYNGRITGSTYIYSEIGMKVVGEDYAEDRVIVDRLWPEGWSVASYSLGLDMIVKAGLAYDRITRKGVILCNSLDWRDNTIMHCVVAEDLAEAVQIEKGMERLFKGPGGADAVQLGP